MWAGSCSKRTKTKWGGPRCTRLRRNVPQRERWAQTHCDAYTMLGATLPRGDRGAMLVAAHLTAHAVAQRTLTHTTHTNEHEEQWDSLQSRLFYLVFSLRSEKDEKLNELSRTRVRGVCPNFTDQKTPNKHIGWRLCVIPI
ncbi:hypothetical protein EVAR_19220_1 [Eumeta japonica]|uniref:Uncharacterized protein n=1 Tax=Eumeta variegata TaxID=151549 RepID=A0A4C1VE02_EUMVA|nr:hypothetical protein EVAR_19220_1 [Eumeta japonica]